MKNCNSHKLRARGYVGALLRRLVANRCGAGLDRILDGTVDPSSRPTYLFVDELAYVQPSLATGTVILRYNVVPAGYTLNGPCCQPTGLMVRFLDNGSGAHVIVRLKQYYVKTGELSTLLTFDSNDYPPQSKFQEEASLTTRVFDFSFDQGPTEGGQVIGCCAYYVEAKLIRSARGGTPGLGSISLVRFGPH